MKKYIIPFIIGSLFFATFAYSAPSIIYQRTLIPERDNAFDLGTSTQNWRNIYGTTLYGDGSNLTGIATLSSLSATSPLAYNSSTGNFYVSSGYEIPTTASTTAWEGKLSTTTAASTYVPYTGATGSVSLGSYNLTAATGTFTGNLHIPTIVNSILSTNGSGLVVATTTTGITSLGGQTGATQTFASSTATNFTFASAGDTHTFYFPSYLDGFNSTSTAYTKLGFANDISYDNATTSQAITLGLNDSAYRVGGGITIATSTSGGGFTAINTGAAFTLKFPSYLDPIVSTSTLYTVAGFANNAMYHNATSSWATDYSLGDMAFRSNSVYSINSQTGAVQTFATSTASASLQIDSAGDIHTLKIGRNLDQINTVATTTGNILVASSTGGWLGFPVGTSGYVLTASSTQYGVSWEAPSASGGGGGYNTISFDLNPSGAAVATSSPAGANKYIGTYWTTHTLDFDGTTSEHAYWNVKFPSFTALNTCTANFTAFADATSTGAVAVMGISYKNVGNSTVFTSVSSSTVSTTVSFLGSVREFMNGSLVISTSSISSADSLLIDLHRRVSETDDTDLSDVRYTNGKLTCTYR